MTRESERDPVEALPLRPVVSGVLVALASGSLHGHGILKRVNERLGSRTIPGPGTLYRTLKEMRADGLVRRVDRPEEKDGRRQYYALTPWGRRVAAAEAARLAAVVDLAREGGLVG